MRSIPTAVTLLALIVSAFVPFGPHALTHALDIRHAHQHDDASHEHEHEGAAHHEHEFQPSQDEARIASSGVQLARPAAPFSVVVLPRMGPRAPAVSIRLARSLDPPPPRLAPHLAALCCGNKAPPTA